MTALGKLFRTTAFKLSAAYLVIFVLFATFLLGYVAWNARVLIAEQATATVQAEIQGLAEQYNSGGLRRLITTIDRRSSQPGSSLYLLMTPAGDRITGNVSRYPENLFEHLGEQQIQYFPGEDAESPGRSALVWTTRLPSGHMLLVGRDLGEADRLRQVIRRAFGWSLAFVVVLALIGGWFVTRRVLGRIDAMTATTRGIMLGDLSGRLAVTGANDELDRLAGNLNAMLDRIEELMTGLKEVSDNIAHDLKTPLTRLRNGAEEALRTARTPEEYRTTLESTIDEADGLIRVFNALLMIARAEAGGARDGMAEFDLADVARDVGELYEPVGEEAGVPVVVKVEDGLTLFGSRELVGQMIANLVDNAIKYAAPSGGGPASAEPEVIVSAGRANGGVVLSVADRGPGIPDSDRGRVLERFVRLEGSRSRPGSGLGLSLAAAVARLHGGRLRLEDNAPGLRVVVELPAETQVMKRAAE